LNEPAATAGETDSLTMAAVWHVRMEEDPSAEDWHAFTVWLETDPRNRRAFDALDAVASDAVRQLADTADTLVPVPHPALLRRLSSRAFLAMAGVAAAMLIAVVVSPRLFYSPAYEIIATAPGERRDVTLSDGSTVHLNTDTRIAVNVSARERDVRLEKGEALFEVAHDEGRPFDVGAGDRTVHVVGTAFNVLRHDGRIQVTVERGKVDVGGGGARDVRLNAGEQYGAREGSDRYQVTKVDPAIASSWREGRIVFTQATLAEVASSLSRYYARPIQVADPNVGNLRFSGILKIEDQLTTVKRLEALLPISVHESADAVRLERGSSQ
jgi:transmembrane sensor